PTGTSPAAAASSASSSAACIYGTWSTSSLVSSLSPDADEQADRRAAESGLPVDGRDAAVPQRIGHDPVLDFDTRNHPAHERCPEAAKDGTARERRAHAVVGRRERRPLAIAEAQHATARITGEPPGGQRPEAPSGSDLQRARLRGQRNPQRDHLVVKYDDARAF